MDFWKLSCGRVAKTSTVLATAVLFAAGLPCYLETHPVSTVGLRSSLTTLVVVACSAMALWVFAWARRRLERGGLALVLLAVAALLITTLFRRFRESSLESFGVLGLAAGATALHLLLVAAGGASILRLLGVRRISNVSHGVLSLLCGWTAWGFAAYLLGLAGCFSVRWLAGLSLGFGVLGVPELAAAVRRFRTARPLLFPRGCEGLVMSAALAGFMLIACFFAGIRAATPPFVFDELMYHLSAPKHYLEVGAIDFYPNIRGSYLPCLSQLHYALFIGLGLDVGAKLANLVLSATLIAVVFEIGREIRGKLAGALAGVLTAFTPIVLWGAGTAYTDNAFTALGLGAFLFCLQGIRRGRPPLIAAAGLLAGGALFTRYQAVYLVGALAASALTAWALEPPPRGARILRASILAACLAIAVPLPFWIHNAWWTGNPVYPLLDRVFPSRGWFDAHDLEVFNRTNFFAFGYGRSVLDLLAFPWRIVMREGRFDAGEYLAIGFPALVLIPLAAWGALRRRRSLPYAIGLGLILGGWFSSMQVARYLIPVLGLLAVLGAAALGQILPRRPAPLLAGTTVLAVLFLGIQARGFIGDKGLPLAGEARTLYLDAHVATHRVLRERVAALPPDAVVWAFMDQQAVYYYPRKVIGDFFGPYKFDRIAASLAPFAFRDGAEVMACLDSWGVTHVLLNLPGTPAYRSREADPRRFLELADPVLRDRLDLLFAENGIYLYRILTAPGERKAAPSPEGPGENLIRNPSFEYLRDAAPEGWGTQGGIEVLSQPGGPAAGHALRTNNRNLVYQRVPVEAGSIYRLSCRARSEADAGSLRVHLVWYGEERKQVAASVSVLDTGPAYQTLIGTFTAPCGAVGAEIFLCGHESGWVLLDEVAFQRIKGRTGT